MRRNKYTINEIKEIGLKKGGKLLSDVYINNKKNLDWECGKCLNKFSNCLKNIVYLHNWCPFCFGKYNNSIDVAVKIAADRDGKCLSTIYTNNKTNLVWECNKCKHIWNARLDRIKSGTWCPKCNESQGEKKIKNFLDLNNIRYQREFIFSTLKNRRFDFYLKDLKTVIEMDGVQHFKINGIFSPNETTLKKHQTRDIEKTLFCEKKLNIIRIDYENVKNIEVIMEHVIHLVSTNDEFKIMFSDSKKYEYIIENIETSFLVFLTGVGKK